MKVWKSPVFYFGILLVMVIAGLLSAPYVIDWNAYRADLEDYGKTLTGRSVKIAGPISAEVFPWPRLTAQGVTIANPPGLENPEFARADRVVVRMTLAGLVRGGIDVESIDVERPVIGLERLATGEGNWVFTPAADLVRSEAANRNVIPVRDGAALPADAGLADDEEAVVACESDEGDALSAL